MAVAAFLGVARAFSMPALNALGPNIVPPDVLPHAIATNAIAGRVGSILGPAMGGYLYAWSPPAPYAASAGLFACRWSACCLSARFRAPWGSPASPGC
jgi:hypothetical protein